MNLFLADARAFAAAVRRDLREIRRYPMLILGSLFWPILLPSMYVLMGEVYGGGDERAVRAFSERTGTVEVTGFVFVGFAMYMWLSLLLWGPGTRLRQEQLRGTLEAVLLTPASRLVMLFGPPVAHLWPVLIQLAVMVAALRFIFGVELDPAALARALAVIVVGVPSMFALASLFAAAVLKFGEIGPAVQFVRGALVLLAGVTYPVAMLPGWAQAAAAAVPTTYIVEDVRAVLLSGLGLGQLTGHLLLLIAFACLISALAVLLYRWIELEARRTGALSQY